MASLSVESVHTVICHELFILLPQVLAAVVYSQPDMSRTP